MSIREVSTAVRSIAGRVQDNQSQLGAMPVRGVAQAVTSAKQLASPGSGGGAGIASPLTETDVSKREYYAQGWITADGLFHLPALKKLVMQDANGAEVVILLEHPAPV